MERHAVDELRRLDTVARIAAAEVERMLADGENPLEILGLELTADEIESIVRGVATQVETRKRLKTPLNGDAKGTA